MCDITTLKCSWCGRWIDTHIGDFSIGRKQIEVFCPRDECQQAALKTLQGYPRTFKHGTMCDLDTAFEPLEEAWREDYPLIVFRSRVTMNSGEVVPVLFLVDWPRDLTCNGDGEDVFVEVPGERCTTDA